MNVFTLDWRELTRADSSSSWFNGPFLMISRLNFSMYVYCKYMWEVIMQVCTYMYGGMGGLAAAAAAAAVAVAVPTYAVLSMHTQHTLDLPRNATGLKLAWGPLARTTFTSLLFFPPSKKAKCAFQCCSGVWRRKARLKKEGARLVRGWRGKLWLGGWLAMCV